MDRSHPGGLPDPKFSPISRSEFEAYRNKVFGQSNPEWIDDAFILYMVHSMYNPYHIREQFDLLDEDIQEARRRPIWTFNRFGRSSTLLPKAHMVVHIGGMSADAFMDDQIFNDVVIQDRYGRYWVYSYPATVFPPTSHHSANLVADESEMIIVIGGRRSIYSGFDGTDVFALEGTTFRPIETFGEAPSAICRHRSVLLPNGRILVSGGEILHPDGHYQHNEQSYELDWSSGIWRAVS